MSGLGVRLIRLAILVCLLRAIPAVTTSSAPAPLLLQLSNCTVPGTSVDSWGLKLTLSAPAQYVCVSPSTAVNSMLVIGSEFCQNYPNITMAQCESLCGNTFNTSAAGTSYNPSSPNAILAPNPVWAEISPQPLLAGATLLDLPPDDLISKLPIGIITDGDHQNVGQLGLATNSEFLQFAHCSGIIPTNGLGFNAGSQSITKPRDGSLVLGGYDLASIDGAFNYFPIGSASSSEKACPFQVTITQLVLRYPMSEGSTDVILTSSGILVPACIEMYDNLFRLPQTILKSFQEVTGWSSDFIVDPNLVVDEPGLYYPQTKGFNGSLIFTLSNGLGVEVPDEEMTNPLRNFDINGAQVLQSDITEVNIFYQDALLSTATLAKRML